MSSSRGDSLAAPADRDGNATHRTRRPLLPPPSNTNEEASNEEGLPRVRRVDPTLSTRVSRAPATEEDPGTGVAERAIQRRMRLRAAAAAAAANNLDASPNPRKPVGTAQMRVERQDVLASGTKAAEMPSDGAGVSSGNPSPKPEEEVKKEGFSGASAAVKNASSSSNNNNNNVNMNPAGSALPPPPPPPVINREAFENPDFSADNFVNSMIHRYLLYALSHAPPASGTGVSPTTATTPISASPRLGDNTTGNFNALVAAGGTGESRSLVDGVAASRPPVKGSDGKDLFSSTHIPMFARRAEQGASGASRELTVLGTSPASYYRNVADNLTKVLQQTLCDVTALQEEEERALRIKEVRGKRVEVNEKRRLATIRVGLEETTNLLQAYENRVENAQAATAGIEQHLAQSNARVQRGKAVSQLLRHFRVLTGMQPDSLSAILKGLGRARGYQRKAVTTHWERLGVPTQQPITGGLFYEDHYLVEDTSSPAALSRREGSLLRGGKGRKAGAGGGPDLTQTSTSASRRAASHKRSSTAGSMHEGPPDESASGKKQRVKRTKSGEGTGKKKKQDGEAENPGNKQKKKVVVKKVVKKNKDGTTTVTTVREEVQAGEKGTSGRSKKTGSSMAKVDEKEEEENKDDTAVVRRAEMMATSAGLDRLFISRSSTEAQVDWCQRLLLLATELKDVAPNAGNIIIYKQWLQQELVSDLFHVVGRFNVLYDKQPNHAAHTSVGRALLKALELISRLYVTLTSSSDDLLTVFFAHAINDLGLTLHSDFSPTPYVGPPPPPAVVDASKHKTAMQHFAQNMERELPRSFRFLVERIRRDVIVVEAMVGSNRTARQQLLSQVTEKVLKPFLTQQIKLAEKQRDMFVDAEVPLSPRSKRRCASRVLDAITYYHSVSVRCFTFFHDVLQELTKESDQGETDFLYQYTDTIFNATRERYSQQREELDLLRRTFQFLEEKYTRALHPLPEELFDLREAHMTKARAMIDALAEVATRVRTFALEKDAFNYTLEVIRIGLQHIGPFFENELKKMLESMKMDKEKWRLKPKSEDELVRPTKPESQHCSFRMLLFVQTGLIMLQDSLHSITRPLLHKFPRLTLDVERARLETLGSLDEIAEKLLNFSVNAIVVKSLSILQHYQHKSDFMPSEKQHKLNEDAVAPPCTRACTLFCYYITRQLAEAKEFIKLSDMDSSHDSRELSSGNSVQPTASSGTVKGGATGSHPNGGKAPSPSSPSLLHSLLPASSTSWKSEAEIARIRARSMSMGQLLYGDGEPSNFVRTLGVCLFRGIAAHLKGQVANDRGALVYKQDVTAYAEAMRPLSSSPSLSGAVVGVLFQMLRETSSLLLMPLDHIKEVKDAGLLQVMSHSEKLAFLKIRQDVRTAFKAMKQ